MYIVAQKIIHYLLAVTFPEIQMPRLNIGELAGLDGTSKHSGFDEYFGSDSANKICTYLALNPNDTVTKMLLGTSAGDLCEVLV